MRCAILAGGQASRFGGKPKGLEPLAGRRMLDLVVDVAEAAFGKPPLLVANDPDAPSWRPDLRVTRDVMQNCGSLGGIYTAVTFEPGPVAVVAWDMPFVTPNLLSALAKGAIGFDVFLPESPGPRGVEPLCGVYGHACASPILMSLASLRFTTTAFHSAVRVGTMPLKTVQSFGDPYRLFFNVNQPADLVRAAELSTSG